MVPWYYYLVHFFAGAFFANGVPHFVQGICGNKFQTPFATPRGVGESSAIVNVLWGFFNIVIGYVLVCRVGSFDLRDISDVAAFGVGAFALALLTARQFGRFNGGNRPEGS